MHLGFACQWDPSSWQRTWSGTPFALRTALIEQGVKLVDISLSLSAMQATLLRLAYARYHPHLHRFISAHRLSRLTLHLLDRQFQRRLPPHLDAVLTIGDLFSPNSSKGIPYFCYADATAAAYYLAEHDPLIGPRLSLRHSHRQYRHRLRWQQSFFQGATKLFFMSRWAQQTACELAGIPCDSTAVVYPGINVPSTQTPVRPVAKPYLLFVGREFLRKCGDLVVKAYTIVRQRYECTLVIAGAPERYKSSLPPEVYWIGDVPPLQLAAYFQHAELFVMPSIFEAFGLVYLEALSYGVPVIARAICAVPELVTHGHNGLLMHPRSESIEELAWLIEQGLTCSPLRQNAQAEMHHIRQQFTWQRTAREMLQHITACVSPR